MGGGVWGWVWGVGVWGCGGVGVWGCGGVGVWGCGGTRPARPPTPLRVSVHQPHMCISAHQMCKFAHRQADSIHPSTRTQTMASYSQCGHPRPTHTITSATKPRRPLPSSTFSGPFIQTQLHAVPPGGHSGRTAPHVHFCTSDVQICTSAGGLNPTPSTRTQTMASYSQCGHPRPHTPSPRRPSRAALPSSTFLGPFTKPQLHAVPPSGLPSRTAPHVQICTSDVQVCTSAGDSNPTPCTRTQTMASYSQCGHPRPHTPSRRRPSHAALPSATFSGPFIQPQLHAVAPGGHPGRTAPHVHFCTSNVHMCTSAMLMVLLTPIQEGEAVASTRRESLG